MKQLSEKQDSTGSKYTLWMIGAMIFIVPLAWWSMKQIHLQNNISNWLPEHDSRSEVLSWYKQQFDVQDHILVSWEGSSLTDPRVEQLTQKIRGVSDQQGIRRGGIPEIESVISPHDLLKRMQKHQISKTEAIRRLQGVLIGRGTLKVELTDSGKDRKERVIREMTQQAHSMLGLTLSWGPSSDEISELEDEEEYDDEEDFVDEGFVDEEELSARSFDMQLFWSEIHSQPEQLKQVQQLLVDLRGRPTIQHPEGERLVEETFFEVGSPVALVISLSDAGREDEQLAFSKLKSAAIAFGIDEKSFHIAGRPVAASELNAEMGQVIWNPDVPLWKVHQRSPLLLSAIVSIVLAFVMLKSFRLTAIILVSTCYVTLLTVAVIPLTGGRMNTVLVIMPTLLIVLTLSASIHVVNYWKQIGTRHPKKGIALAMKLASRPCILAAVTTVIGLLSLTTSTLSPVRDFGFYTAVGCGISLIVILFGLPAILQLVPSTENQTTKNQAEPNGWNLLGHGVSVAKVPVFFVGLLLFAVCLCGLTRFKTESKVIHYFPDQSRIVKDYQFIEEHLSGVIPVDLVIRFDQQSQETTTFIARMEQVRKIEEKIRQHPDVSGTLGLADFQQVHTFPTSNANRLTRIRFGRRSHLIEQQIKEKSVASRAFLMVAQDENALQKIGGENFSISAGDELWRITAQVSLMGDVDYITLCGNETIKGDLNHIARSELKYFPGANHIITGTVPLFMQTQQAVLDSLIASSAFAFVAIAVVMMILLKNPIAGLLAMLPNLMPIGVVIGLISWNGLAFDIGTMMTAAVALGIAVDGTLHLLTWFKAGLEAGLSREQSVSRALSHCGPTMLQTSLIISAGLLMLSPSELLLVQRFSWMMACLVGSALVADVIFLPALLAGPLGLAIESTMAGKRQQQFHRTDDPAEEMLQELAANVDAEGDISEEHEPHPRVIKISRSSSMNTQVD